MVSIPRTLATPSLPQSYHRTQFVSPRLCAKVSSAVGQLCSVLSHKHAGAEQREVQSHQAKSLFGEKLQASNQGPPGVRHQPKEVEAIFPQACRLAEALRPAEESRITAPVSAGETTAPPTRPRSVQGLGHDSEQVSAVLVGVVRCLHPAGRRDGVKEGGSERGREGRALLRVEIETEVQNSTRFSPTDRFVRVQPTCVAETRFGGKSAFLERWTDGRTDARARSRALTGAGGTSCSSLYCFVCEFGISDVNDTTSKSPDEIGIGDFTSGRLKFPGSKRRRRKA
ncbi:hypothetical protein KOW79_014990 [Hemibagrus wyckioides]|uniref:Uncharacterized protein n=1 Tax=Hemibagrus wyckioides TaxID=337641 RepID=A0A9D3SFB1_9TELE|nr:hypothetical protein KOW79_014990 [Hemibagrus wyckioides]